MYYVKSLKKSVNLINSRAYIHVGSLRSSRDQKKLGCLKPHAEQRVVFIFVYAFFSKQTNFSWPKVCLKFCKS